jgi:hypothetical protein
VTGDSVIVTADSGIVTGIPAHRDRFSRIVKRHKAF